MTALTEVKDIWDTLKEVDLYTMREEALRGVHFALLGSLGSGRSDLALSMRRDPSHPDMVTHSPVMLLEPDELSAAFGADLIILVVDGLHDDFLLFRKLADECIDAGQNVMVFINHYGDMEGDQALSVWMDWDMDHIVYGDAQNAELLLDTFVPTVINLLSQQTLSLARSFPLFRVRVANTLINDTCLSNAVYSFSTGLAEMVPVLGLPLNIADIFILTKMQAFLVYKLGLALGYSVEWQDYIAEFSGVLGGGFMWRQAARSLVGLIPGYGIVPKVAIAYSGTYVVGQVVLRWYLTGKHLNAKEIKGLYREAMGRGKDVAKRLVKRKPEKVTGDTVPQLPAKEVE
jgi:uncharacterized protein (DUF697 family)